VGAGRRLILWAVAVAAAAVLAFPVFGELGGNNDFNDPHAEAVAATRAIEASTGAEPSPGMVVIARQDLSGVLRGPGIARVQRVRTAYFVTFKRDDAGAIDRIRQALAGRPGVLVGGPVIAGRQLSDQVSKDIARAELFAFPILFVLSLLVFRSLVAALLPLAVAVTTILLSFVAIRLVNHFNPMSIFALNLINGVGLGLAIDYSLFMVTRYREELPHGREAALATTMRTAGHTVRYSGLTVAAALAALLIFRQRFLYSMGVGGAICALLASLVSLTLLPALLAMLGERVGGRLGEPDNGFWYRHSWRVMRHPVAVAVGAGAVLIALGLPFTSIRWTGIDASDLPKSAPARRVDDLLPSAGSAPIVVAGRCPTRFPGAVTNPGYVSIPVHAPPLSGAAQALVRRVRSVCDGPVGGQTAAFMDQQSSLGAHLPAALAILVVTTLVILFAMTGSVVLPVKALVMNLLTISAAFGALVLVFQEWDGLGAIESSQPVLLFAVAFALSTDYGVFLLGRIKELHDAGLPNAEAVALGLQRTGRLVTYAAALMVVAIGAFVTARIVFIQELGFGVAVAVLIDATVVRALLVPALMRLLGDWNWWAPRPLARLRAA
jgi:RND superfamily putative drug exporter